METKNGYVIFASSNTKAAKVGKTSGIISCVGVGKAVITAKAAESSQYKAAIKVKGKKAISKIFQKLKSGKKFKVRIRGYKEVKGTTYYGNYSKWKTLKKVR